MTDAINNAQAWLKTIAAAMSTLDRLEADDTPQLLEGEAFEDADTLRERLYQTPLSVSVRSDWSTPNDTLTPSGYQILLSTGGPALRIVGDLNVHGEAETARLEYQDWGTPWTSYTLAHDEAPRVLAFAGLFYLG